MTAIALAAFFGLAGIGYAAAHQKPTNEMVLCASDGPYVFDVDAQNRTTVNGRVLPAGHTFRYNPPICRFSMRRYRNGPLLVE